MNLWTRLWWPVQGLWLTLGTRARIGDRECGHDGSEPFCDSCAVFFNGV